MTAPNNTQMRVWREYSGFDPHYPPIPSGKYARSCPIPDNSDAFEKLAYGHSEGLGQLLLGLQARLHVAVLQFRNGLPGDPRLDCQVYLLPMLPESQPAHARPESLAYIVPLHVPNSAGLSLCQCRPWATPGVSRKGLDKKKFSSYHILALYTLCPAHVKHAPMCHFAACSFNLRYPNISSHNILWLDSPPAVTQTQNRRESEHVMHPDIVRSKQSRHHRVGVPHSEITLYPRLSSNCFWLFSLHHSRSEGSHDRCHSTTSAALLPELSSSGLSPRELPLDHSGPTLERGLAR